MKLNQKRWIYTVFLGLVMLTLTACGSSSGGSSGNSGGLHSIMGARAQDRAALVLVDGKEFKTTQERPGTSPSRFSGASFLSLSSVSSMPAFVTLNGTVYPVGSGSTVTYEGQDYSLYYSASVTENFTCLYRFLMGDPNVIDVVQSLKTLAFTTFFTGVERYSSGVEGITANVTFSGRVSYFNEDGSSLAEFRIQSGSLTVFVSFGMLPPMSSFVYPFTLTVSGHEYIGQFVGNESSEFAVAELYTVDGTRQVGQVRLTNDDKLDILFYDESGNLSQ